MINADLDEKSRENSYRILVFDSMSVCVTDTSRMEAGKTLVIPEVISALSGTDAQNLQNFGNIMYAASSVKNESSTIVGAVLIVSSIDEVFQPIADIERRLIYFVAIIFVFIICFVYVVSGLYTAPLRSVMTAVIKMSQGHLNIRTEIKGRDEFAEMGKAFNIMAEKLELAEKSREEFVSNVSHELKTPLSSIKVLSESILLQKDVPAETYMEFLLDINSEIDRMTYIVNDLLALVKLDRREVTLDFKPVDVSFMIMEVLKRLFLVARRKNIHIAFEEMKKVIIEADEMKLASAVSNIVDNAVKYTPEGGVVKVTADADHQNLFITVTDTGVGISEDEQSKIFDRFYRVDKTRDRETGGTGLGLAITHATVLLHNGAIRVVSRENEGSTFIMSLPLHQNVKRGE
jgi:signal transduction histidine kinase